MKQDHKHKKEKYLKKKTTHTLVFKMHPTFGSALGYTNLHRLNILYTPVKTKITNSSIKITIIDNH